MVLGLRYSADTQLLLSGNPFGPGFADVRPSLMIRALLLFVLLSVCAPVALAERIVLWHNQDTPEPLASILADFTRDTGISVEAAWIVERDFKALLLRHREEKTLPDVMMVPADYLGLDKDLRFSEVSRHGLNSDLMPKALASAFFEGRELAVPVMWGNHLMLFWNRSLVERPARSFAEMTAQAPSLRARGIKVLALSYSEMYWLVPFFGAFGGWPVDDSGAPTLDTRAVQQGLQFYADLATTGLVDRKCTHECIAERFARGEFAYAIGGDWMIRDLKARLGNRFGIAVLPRIGERDLVPMFSSHVLAFPGRSLSGSKQAALLRFARYMQSEAVQQRWARARMFPVNARVFNRLAVSPDADTRAALAQMQLARAMPNCRGMAFAWVGMARGFALLQKGRSPAEAAASMQTWAKKMAQRDTE